VRIVVIGATGHIGGYLVPQLVEQGHDVVAVSRGVSELYRDDPSWDGVAVVNADRSAESDAAFAERIARLGADVVIDMICFTEPAARALVDALQGRASLLVHVGTIWVHGTLTEVPATEDAPRRPWGSYGVQKAAIERFLLGEATKSGLPVAIVHPGHISGPGWPVIGPQGTVDVGVWRRLAGGEEVLLPGFGLETVHHVHAEDVATLISLCISRRGDSAGQAFHAVSRQALTLRGLAESAAGWFQRPANLRFLPYQDFLESVPAEFRQSAFEHIARSHSMSIEKARTMLGYEPRHSSLDAVHDAVEWLQRHGRLGEDVPVPVRR
jgi:nucleoside-diphosphate-sugar epimerase